MTVKYLLAYILPLVCWIGLTLGGWFTFLTPLLAFGLLPTLELFLKGNSKPIRPWKGAAAYFYDVLVYMHVPITYFLILLFCSKIAEGSFSPVEILGCTFSVGIICGSFGMNLGHELGHRSGAFDRFMANLLWLPNLYMHFGIEHNLWHHTYVATDEDPASAPEGMSIYQFWYASVLGNIKTAWKVDRRRLTRTTGGLRFNKMYLIIAVELLYLIVICSFFGVQAMLLMIAAAIIGFLLLESVNYIEHYGLRRRKLESGRYEPLGPQHSWNSDHDLGRIFLYELTRHSDHHLNAMKKYQTLDSLQGSPQLPYGYPGSILLALFPSMWKKKMAAELRRFEGS